MAKCILCEKEAVGTSKLGYPVCADHKASDDANIVAPAPVPEKKKKDKK